MEKGESVGHAHNFIEARPGVPVPAVEPHVTEEPSSVSFDGLDEVAVLERLEIISQESELLGVPGGDEGPSLQTDSSLDIRELMKFSADHSMEELPEDCIAKQPSNDSSESTNSTVVTSVLVLSHVDGKLCRGLVQYLSSH